MISDIGEAVVALVLTVVLVVCGVPVLVALFFGVLAAGLLVAFRHGRRP